MEKELISITCDRFNQYNWSILSSSEISERFLVSGTQGFRWTRRTTVHSKPKPIWFPRAAPPLDGFGIGCRVRQASHASQAGWRPTVALAVHAAHNVDVEHRHGRARTGTLSFEDSFVLPPAWLAGANGRSKSHLRRSPALLPSFSSRGLFVLFASVAVTLGGRPPIACRPL